MNSAGSSKTKQERRGGHEGRLGTCAWGKWEGELEMDIEQDISLTFMKLSHNKQEIVCFKKERKKEN